MTHTLESLKAWLADDSNFIGGKHEYGWVRNGLSFYGVRKHFVCSNGKTVSIQQSATHSCNQDSAELWCCPHHDMLGSDENGLRENAYTYVPLTVVVDYLNWLETLS